MTPVSLVLQDQALNEMNYVDVALTDGGWIDTIDFGMGHKIRVIHRITVHRGDLTIPLKEPVSPYPPLRIERSDALEAEEQLYKAIKNNDLQGYLKARAAYHKGRGRGSQYQIEYEEVAAKQQAASVDFTLLNGWRLRMSYYDVAAFITSLMVMLMTVGVLWSCVQW